MEVEMDDDRVPPKDVNDTGQSTLEDNEYERQMRADRRTLEARLQEIQQELQATQHRITAIDGYFDLRDGKRPAVVAAPAQPAPTPRPPKDPDAPKATRAPRGSGDSYKAKVLDIIKANPKGLLSNQVKERLDAEGVEVKGLPNILSQLKKAGEITQSAKREPFFPKFNNPTDEDENDTDDSR